jgi:hypothetical protein
VRPAAVAEQQQRVIREAGREARVVQAHRHGSPVVREAPEDPQHVELMLRIELLDRFIQQVIQRVLGQHRGSGQASPLAARQGADVAIVECGQVDRCQATVCHGPVRIRFPLPEAEVRMPPDQYRVQRGGRKRVLVDLRQQPDATCEVALRPVVQRAPTQCDFASRCFTQTRQGMQRRALARAIAPEDGQDGTGVDLQVEVLHQRASRYLQREPQAAQRRIAGSRAYRVHPISRAVSLPTVISSRLSGTTAACCETATRPAISSPSA